MKRLLVVALLFCTSPVWAQVVPAGIFSDGMVLQQQSRAALWGKAPAGKTVTVTTGWDSRSYSAHAAVDSTWSVTVATPAASYDRYTISITCGNTVTLRDVLVGEVWLCSGQSNMAMTMRGSANQPVENSLADIVASGDEYLRCYTVARRASVVEERGGRGEWKAASPSNTPGFTAAGYYYGRLLRKVLGVPVGLIDCSFGGASIEAWMPRDVLARFEGKDIPGKIVEGMKVQVTPALLYNGMLSNVAGYGMKGALWYQGEANRIEYKQYPALFEAMHRGWEEKWGVGAFPIYTVQIAPYDYSVKGPGQGGYAPFMREVQYRIAHTLPRTGVAVLVDAGEKECIHPARKREAGERLAYVALAKSYGYDIEYESPHPHAWTADDGRMAITFAPAGRLTSFGRELSEFEIAGADRKFHSARARITEKGVEVWSPEVTSPVAVRYAFRDYVKGSLLGINGLPVSSFRTDDWDDVK